MKQYTLTSTTAAKLLNISSSTLRRMSNRGEIHCFKINATHRRYCEQDLKAWQKNKETLANSQNREEAEAK